MTETIKGEKQMTNDFCIVSVSEPAQNSGFRVYRKVWQSHRNGQPIKTPKSKRRPRLRFVDVFITKEEAEKTVKDLSTGKVK
jgi:hypothetical protein